MVAAIDAPIGQSLRRKSSRAMHLLHPLTLFFLNIAAWQALGGTGNGGDSTETLPVIWEPEYLAATTPDSLITIAAEADALVFILQQS